MKTFEENWTAWVDGQLTGRELEEFKASLPDLAAAELEKDSSLKLGNFLRAKIGVPAMPNEDFFLHKLQQEIARDQKVTAPVPAKARESWWSIGRLAWSGAAALAALTLFTVIALREQDQGGQSAYLTQIVNARVDPAVSPNATITIFEAKDEKVTVVWVNGLQSLPAEFAAR